MEVVFKLVDSLTVLEPLKGGVAVTTILVIGCVLLKTRRG